MRCQLAVVHPSTVTHRGKYDQDGRYGSGESVAGRWHTSMDMEVADDLVDLLNEMDRKAKEKPAG